jgi:hypothetical protein
MKTLTSVMLAGLLWCASASAEDALDTVELRFAQAKQTPTTRDDLFGAPPAPRATPAVPAAPPKSKDELFGAPPAPRAKPPASKDELFGAPARKSTPPATQDELFGEPKKESPASKDELFGKPAAPAKPAEPSTKDELFTPAPAAQVPRAAPETASASGPKWSGFVSEEIAYTYSEPNHWSRAVTRVQLTGQGQWGSVKYKISGRFDADPVYFSSNFYPEDVQNDQDMEFFLRENYIDFTGGPLEFRVGRQQIVWGEVVGLFFADVVSAQDMRDFILPSFDIMRIPQWAARAEYFSGDFHAELIWIPVQSVDNIGEPDSEFYPVGMMGRPDSIYREVDEPARNLSNSAYGLRVNTLLSGWDLAAFYYRSHANAPAFYREFQLIDGNPVAVFTPRHDRIWKVGSTVSKDLGPFVLRGEAIYTNDQPYSIEDLNDADGVVKRNTFEFIVGLDYTTDNDSRINVQGFHRAIAGGDEDDLRPEIGGPGFTVLLSTKLTPAWEPQILWIQHFNDGDRLVRPRINWYAARNTRISFGADIFSGPTTGVFGRYGDRDRLYGELRYDF